jgi:hypothetical protein
MSTNKSFLRARMAFTVVALSMVAIIAAPQVGVAAKRVSKTTRTTTTTTSIVVAAPSTPPATDTTALPTTTAAKVTTTTELPGKNMAFSFEFPLVGPGAPAPIVPVCTPDLLGCVAATVTPQGAQREVSGDFIGFVVTAGAATTYGQKNVLTGYLAYSGAVPGCGVGTFVATTVTESATSAQPPAVGGKFANDVARWEIVRGSGTKGLAGMSGSGTFEVVRSGPATARNSYSGRFVCTP